MASLGGVDLKGIPTGDTLMQVKKTSSFAQKMAVDKETIWISCLSAVIFHEGNLCFC